MIAVDPRHQLAGIIGHAGVICFVTVLGLAAVLGMSIMPRVGAARPSSLPTVPASPAALDAARFIPNASSPGAAQPSVWETCGAICLLGRCPNKPLWSSSSPPGFACPNAGSCAMAACFAPSRI